MKLNGKPIDILRVVDLKEELAKRDLPKHGKKQDLVQRLANYLQQNPHECDAEGPDIGPDVAGGGESAPISSPIKVVSEQLAQNDAVAEYLRMRESALENAQQLQQRPEPAVYQVEKPQLTVETPPQQVPVHIAPEVTEAIVQKVPAVAPESAPSQPEANAAIAQVTKQCSQEDVSAVAEEKAVVPTPERAPTPPPPQPKSQPEAEVQQEHKQTSPPEERAVTKPPIQIKEAEELPTQARENEEPRPQSPVQKEDNGEGAKDVPADVKVAEPPVKLPEVEEEMEKADDSVVVTVDATDLTFGDESLNTSTTKEQAKKPQEEREDDDPHNFRMLKDLEPESSQLVSLRKIQRRQSKDSSNGEDAAAGKKRTWGTSKYSKEEIRIKEISSKSLKDIVPDIKPLLSEETEVDLERKYDEDEDEGRRKPSRHASTEEKKKPKITATSSVIRIDNLVRPFTVNQMKELLARTGTLVEDSFWINKVKSTCLVAYSTKEEAEETIAALDGVKWPSSNPKQISVKPSTEEELNAFLSGTADTRQNGSAPRNNREDNRPRDISEVKKRPIADEDDEARNRKKRRREEESSGGGAGKTLEELFRKTKTQPSIYWLPNDGKP